MLDTVVIDDEFHALERMKEFVVQAKELNLVGGYTQVHSFITDIKENKVSPEVLFLDIEMPGCNGLQLAERVLEIDDRIDIIFVTAYESYAVKAFELNALDYLLKPFNEERFQKTMSRLIAKRKVVNNRDSKLRVSSLGNFRVFYQGEEIRLEWRTAKTQELFLYLLHHQGDFVDRDKIAEVLWGNKDPEKAVDILYTTVYSLRKMFKNMGFGQIINSKQGFYSLNMKQVNWDVLEFEKLVDKVKEDVKVHINKVERIIDLYQEEYLISKGYHWAYGLRAELKEKFKTSLTKAADYYVTEKEYEKVIGLLKRVIKEVFLDVRAHKKLIEIYKLLGDEVAARREYEKLKARLQEEFGVEPQIDL